MPTITERTWARFVRTFGVGIRRVLCYEAEAGDVVDICPGPGVTFDVLAPQRVAVLATIWPVDLDEMRQRLAGGDLCYLGSLDGIPVHHSWVCRTGQHRILPAGRKLPVSEGDFWIYECRTADSAKGKGIYPAALSRILRDHFAQGYRRGRIYTTTENEASQRGILKAGFHPTETLKGLRLGQFYVPIP